MAEDALDALLKSKSTGRRSRLPGLKVADILTMPPEQQSLVNWLLRHYEANAETIAGNIQQEPSQVQASLQQLTQAGLLKTIDRQGDTLYRVKLAPKSGRQMPTDVWEILDGDTKQANVFISYSRRNKEFVQELYAALDATGREVWVDWENIPVAVDWWQEIQLGIELADTFVFVLSPDSVASKVCGQEIEEALRHNKRLVPLVCQDVQPDQVHPELARLNWIFLRTQDDFQQGFKSLLEALDQDLDYVRTHTRLLVRALEWDRNNRDSSYLLRGADLERAHRYLAQGKDQEPRPTALHHQYVIASAEVESAVRDAELARQKAAIAGQQRWLQLVTAASVLAIAMGIMSWGLSRKAQTAQKLAEQSQIKALSQSALALFLSNRRFDALLSATQAGQLFQSLDAEQPNEQIRAQVLSALQQTLYWVRERNRLVGHTGTVWEVAFSPDEQKLASVSADANVRLWALDGTLLNTLLGTGSPLLDVDFAPDGDRLAAVDAEGSLHLWTHDGQLEAGWQAHKQPARAVAFAPTGNLVATASEDATVKIWTLTGELITTLTGDIGGFQALVWTADNQVIAGDEQGNVYVWQATGEPVGQLQEGSSAVIAIDLSPDGKTLASVGADRQVKLFDLTTQSLIRTFPGHEGPIYNVQFTPDGEQLITVGDDKVVRIWKLDGTPAASLYGHTGLIAALAISPDGGLIATSGGDHAVRLWDLSQHNLHVLLGHDGPVNAVAAAAQRDLIASGGIDGTIRLWKEEGSDYRKILQGHTNSVNAIAFSPTDIRLASASTDGTVRLWDNLDAESPTSQAFSGHVGSVNGVAFHPGGEIIASVGEDHSLRLWRLDGTLIAQVDAHRDGAFGVDFSPDGQYVVTTGWDHLTKIWPVEDIAQAEPRVLREHQSWVLDAQFSPDGDRLATASYDNTVNLWDVETGELTATLEGHEDGVLAVAFTPDGQQLVTGSNDNSIRLWTLAGQPVSTLSGHTQGVRAIAISPQEGYVVSGSSDGRAIIWEPEGLDDIDALLSSSCQWLSDYVANSSQADPEIKALCQAENEMTDMEASGG
ncbi:MAG: toll/interleukin-1 receptor domain-containing protein [Leptolyngbyaceae cyanobacterium]